MAKRSRARTQFTWTNFLIRFVAAIVLVFATYNPEGYSYVHWVFGNMFESLQSAFISSGDAAAVDAAAAESDGQTTLVLKVLAGIVLLIGWVIFLRATFEALGVIGTLLAIAFFGTVMWLIVAQGWVAADNVRAISYLLLVALAGVISTGVSWSHIRRRISGQLDVVNEE